MKVPLHWHPALAVAISAALVNLALPSLRADTYQYGGGTFGDPSSWIDIDTGTHNVPKAGDTASFNDGTVTTPGGQTFGVVECGGSLTFTGGSLTAGQVEARLFLQSSTLTVQNAGGLNLAEVFIDSASQLTALADTAGNVQVQGGVFQARANYGSILNVSSGGGVAVAGNATLDLEVPGTVDGAGSTLAVNGSLSLSNGAFVVQNGGNVTSGSGIIGTDSAGAGSFNPSANVYLTGSGSQWTVNGLLQVGLFATAPGPTVQVGVANGATLTTQGLDLGVGVQSPSLMAAGTGTFGGPPVASGGTILVTGPIRVGVAATNGARLNINAGSHFEMTSSFPLQLAIGTGTDGRVYVSGPNTVANFGATPINVGVAGFGIFAVSGTNAFTSGPVQVAVEATSGRGNQGASLLSVQDPGTSWTLQGPLSVGVAGSGWVYVNDGAQLVTSGESVLGQEAKGVGLAGVWGLAGNGTSTLPTEWLAEGGVTVGDSGSGTLNLQFGGSLVLPAGADFTAGSELSSTGAVWVIGTPLAGTQTLLDARASSVTIGDSGYGGLTNSNGGQMFSGDADIGSEVSGTGTVTLQDPGTKWTVIHDLTVGTKGSGTLLAQNQATLSVGNNLVAGDESTAHGKATFTGSGTAVTVNRELTDGGAGTGTILVQLGATLTTDSATLAEQPNSTGKLTVSGGDALFATRTDLTIGARGVGGLTVSGPATVRTGKDATVAEGLNSLSTASLSAGGVWIVEGDLTAGSKGIAGVSVSTGAHLFALGSMTLAEEAGSGASVSFDSRDTNGVPAALTYAGDLVVGEAGDAKFTLTNDAVALVATNGSGRVSLAPSPTATAKLTIASTNSFLQANSLTVAVGEDMPGGQGSITLLNGGQVSVAQQVETGDGGVIDVRGGNFTLGATNPVAAFGTLEVNPGGRLAGCGRIKGKVINAGGEVAPGCSPGTLTVEGDYTQTASGSLTLRITGGVGGGGSNDLLSVTGNIALAGKVTLNFINSFAPRQGQSFLFLQFGGNLSGPFDQVVVTGLAPGFQYQIQTNSNALVLVAENNGVATSSPLLTAIPAGGQMVIGWPAAAADFTLQGSPTLDLTNWANIVTGTNQFIISPTGSMRFFRLFKSVP